MRRTVAACFAALAIGATADAQELDDRMCAGRDSCALVATHQAGSDPDGVRLGVIELGFAAQDGPDDGGWGCRFDPDGYEGGREYWLVADDGTPPERLATICNDGYGAAMVGEDFISFGDNLMVQERYGGSAWRWVDAVTMTLRPRRLLTRYLCSAYGAWTRYVEATDWTRSVSWYAWSPTPPEEETEWCPRIDPTQPRPTVPKPYLLGAMVPGYENAAMADGDFQIAGLGSCGLGLVAADGPSAPIDPADAQFRVAALSDPDTLVVRLVLALSPDLADAAGGIRLDVTRAEYEALDWLASDRAEPSPYRTSIFPLPHTPGTRTFGPWALQIGPSGPDGTILYVDRAPAADSLEISLLGLAVSVMAADDRGEALVSTVTWQDGIPAHAPPIAWRPAGPGWPSCELNEAGMLVLDGPATANPLDVY